MLAAEGFELVFRTLHIMAGVAWAGSAFLFTVFIEPAAAKLGPAAGPFMEETIGRRKVPEIVTAIAAVTVIAGWIRWFRDSDRVGSYGDWLDTTVGLVLGIPPNLKRLNELGAQVEAADGTPTPEQSDTACPHPRTDANAVLDRSLPARGRRLLHGDRALLVNEPRRC